MSSCTQSAGVCDRLLRPLDRRRIATRALGLVMEWAAEHQAELAEDWCRASSGEPIVRIAPLAWNGLTMLTIRSVETLDDYWLRLTLSDRTTIERDVSDLLRGPVFEGLRTNYAEFRQARVRHGSVEWPGDLDLAPEALIWDGPVPHDSSRRPPARLVLHHPTGEPVR